MTELIDRYVHQVGRYLPRHERAEIETELRSQIRDQLDDRYGASPSPADVAAVLAELGAPRQIAASYSGERCLVGPALYPIMMLVLRSGWPLILALVVLLNGVGALVSSEPASLVGLVIETILGGAQAVLVFSAVVVLIFALLEHNGVALQARDEPFNPRNLPPVNDPGTVDRVEAAFGIAIGTFVSLLLLYFSQVGGLTLRISLSDPGEVVPVPIPWLLLLLIVTIVSIVLHLWALWRNRWSLAGWGLLSTLELVGAVCLYFVLYTPLFQYLAGAAPALSQIPYFDRQPEIITFITIGILLLSNGGRLLRLMKPAGSRTTPFTIMPQG